jgi:hypothetical protein
MVRVRPPRPVRVHTRCALWRRCARRAVRMQR